MHFSATSEHGFGVWFLPCHHPVLPFLPFYILKEGPNIPRPTCTPTGQGSSCHWESTSIARGLCIPGGLGLWSRGSGSLLVLLRRLSTGYRQQGEGCALENFKPVCDLMLWFCILAKHLSRKALCYTPEGPAQGSR